MNIKLLCLSVFLLFAASTHHHKKVKKAHDHSFKLRTLHTFLNRKCLIKCMLKNSISFGEQDDCIAKFNLCPKLEPVYQIIQQVILNVIYHKHVCIDLRKPRLIQECIAEIEHSLKSKFELKLKSIEQKSFFFEITTKLVHILADYRIYKQKSNFGYPIKLDSQFDSEIRSSSFLDKHEKSHVVDINSSHQNLIDQNDLEMQHNTHHDSNSDHDEESSDEHSQSNSDHSENNDYDIDENAQNLPDYSIKIGHEVNPISVSTYQNDIKAKNQQKSISSDLNTNIHQDEESSKMTTFQHAHRIHQILQQTKIDYKHLTAIGDLNRNQQSSNQIEEPTTNIFEHGKHDHYINSELLTMMTGLIGPIVGVNPIHNQEIDTKDFISKAKPYEIIPKRNPFYGKTMIFTGKQDQVHLDPSNDELSLLTFFQKIDFKDILKPPKSENLIIDLQHSFPIKQIDDELNVQNISEEETNDQSHNQTVSSPVFVWNDTQSKTNEVHQQSKDQKTLTFKQKTEDLLHSQNKVSNNGVVFHKTRFFPVKDKSGNIIAFNDSEPIDSKLVEKAQKLPIKVVHSSINEVDSKIEKMIDKKPVLTDKKTSENKNQSQINNSNNNKPLIGASHNISSEIGTQQTKSENIVLQKSVSHSLPVKIDNKEKVDLQKEIKPIDQIKVKTEANDTKITNIEVLQNNDKTASNAQEQKTTNVLGKVVEHSLEKPLEETKNNEKVEMSQVLNENEGVSNSVIFDQNSIVLKGDKTEANQINKNKIHSIVVGQVSDHGFVNQPKLDEKTIVPDDINKKKADLVKANIPEEKIAKTDKDENNLNDDEEIKIESNVTNEEGPTISDSSTKFLLKNRNENNISSKNRKQLLKNNVKIMSNPFSDKSNEVSAEKESIIIEQTPKEEQSGWLHDLKGFLTSILS